MDSGKHFAIMISDMLLQLIDELSNKTSWRENHKRKESLIKSEQPFFFSHRDFSPVLSVNMGKSETV